MGFAGKCYSIKASEVLNLSASSKLDTKISIEEMAQKIQLSQAETEDILYYRIDHFTLDRLVDYATRLFKPFEVKMIVERKKDNLHAQTV